MTTAFPGSNEMVCGLVFVGVRVSALLVFAPFLGSPSIPVQVKASLAVVLTALLYPVVRPNLVVFGLGDWLRIVLGEMAIGLLLGLAVNLVFDAAQLAGQAIGFQMGFSLVNVIDPQTQVDTPVLSIFQQLLVLLLFLRMDVHHWLLRGVAHSFQYLPAGTIRLTPAAAMEMLHAGAGIFVAGLEIAAPVLAATLIADVALGFLGKASPQLPVLFVGLSVKSVLGFAVLAAALALWPARFERYFSDGIALGERVLHLAH